MSAEVKAYLAKTDSEFQKTYAAVKKMVKKYFPNAKEFYEYGISGFKARTTKTLIKDWPGTMDPNFAYIGLARRTQGITLHGWCSDYYFLDKHKTELAKAGFKVMRGCVQWNKKAPYPLPVVEKLIAAMAKVAKARK